MEVRVGGYHVLGSVFLDGDSEAVEHAEHPDEQHAVDSSVQVFEAAERKQGVRAAEAAESEREQYCAADNGGGRGEEVAGAVEEGRRERGGQVPVYAAEQDAERELELEPAGAADLQEPAVAAEVVVVPDGAEGADPVEGVDPDAEGLRVGQAVLAEHAAM